MKAKPLPDLDPAKGYLMSLTMENIRCFGSPAETLYMTKLGDPTKPARWTVILGANGVGKTTLLRALASYGSEVGGIWQFTYPRYFERSLESSGRIEYADSRKKVRLVSSAFKSGNSIQPSQNIIQIQETAKLDFPLVAYGANRAWRGASQHYAGVADTLFDRTAQSRNPSEILANWTSYEQSKPPKSFSIVESLTEAFVAILPGVTAVVLDFDREKRPFAKFKTNDGWIALDDMSWGYQVFAAFAADYASRLIEWYPNSKTPLAEPGICLVDELDLHMHPSWQRKVIDDLSRIFPATQFIVTVHSPLVVQAAEDANLVVLKRYPEDPSRVQIDNDVEAIKGWRIDQVLTSDLFGLESSRPPSVVDDLAERRKLLGKNTLTDEEAARLKILDDGAMSLPIPGSAFEQEALKLIAEAAAKLKQLG
jgi:energy-coupling factor transporter ATP-binding protein EcfA2